MNIPLGFELETGRPVSVPLGHTVITGQTQESGKTTTLEAMIARSGLRGIAFVTKRGEASFTTGRALLPYFRESADWQFVEALLESAMREKMKFQRSWIMKVCSSYHDKKTNWQKPRTLQQVAANVETALQFARGLNEGVYRELSEYLKIVLPQIDALPRTDSLTLGKGINVMYLDTYTLEMQCLVIGSVLEWISEHETDTITVIPEAWKIIPAERNSPVRLACEHLGRQGAALKNYIWIDSQDIAGVHRTLLRQMHVWILGVQRDRHEIERSLDAIPDGVSKPRSTAIMRLKQGQFFAAHGDDIRQIYVQPAWMSADEACAVALTRAIAPVRPKTVRPREDEMFREKAEELQEEVNDLKARLLLAETDRDKLKAQIGTRDSDAESADALPAEQFSAKNNSSKSESLESMSDFVLHSIKSNSEMVPLSGDVMASLARDVARILTGNKTLELTQMRPEIVLSMRREVISLSSVTLCGQLAGLIAEGFFDECHNGQQAYNELKRRGSGTAKPNVYRELGKLAGMGFLTVESDGYQKVPGIKITKQEIATQ